MESQRSTSASGENSSLLSNASSLINRKQKYDSNHLGVILEYGSSSEAKRSSSEMDAILEQVDSSARSNSD